MDKSRDIRKLTLQERKVFFNSFDIIMTDCDGVLWLNETPINGALETLKMFQELGKKIIFVSNNATRSLEEYVEKFRKMGYETTPDQIIIPSLSIAWYLKKIGFKSKALTIATQPFIKTLVDNGIDVITGPDSIEENSSVVYKTLSNPPDVGAIILDFDINLNFIKLAQVESLLKKKDILFLVGTRDSRVPMTETRSILGPGPFVDLLIKCSDCKPIECAKPSSVLKDYLFERFSITKPERCMFIGDSLSMDMKFAELCGFIKVWVASGIDKVESVYNACAIPDYFLPNLGTMPTFRNL